METGHITLKLLAAFVVGSALVFVSLNAGGGSLEPAAPPGPTMRTLDEIYTAAASSQQPVVTSRFEPFLKKDAFLRIEGVPGESPDDKHKNWIELLSYSHRVSMPPVDPGGGGTPGRVEHQDFSVVKELDKASPKLHLFCCQGQHIPGPVQLELVRDESDRNTFYAVKLYDVIITSVRSSGTGSGREDVPLEEVTFNYGKIEWSYTEFDEAGNPQGKVEAYWDVQNNTGG